MAVSVRRSRLLLQTSMVSHLGAVSIAGYIRNSRGISLTRLRTFGKYALVYLVNGSGRMRSGDAPTIPCRAGDLLFVYPEIPHGYGPGPGESWNEFYLVFDGPVFDLWRQMGLLNPENPVRHLPSVSSWLPQMEAVADPRLPDNAEGMLRRVCRLQKFLSDIMKRPAVSGHDHLPWLEAARRELMEKPDASAETIARGLGLSYETFRKLFARHTGHAPMRYRAIKLIEQAQVLMTERNLSNKEIAETLGFYDEFHFSRRFRQITGKSTRHFRRQFRTA
jgi:AraC-like DNA-binding protein